MQSISPVLDVRDVDASINYYRNALQFPEGDVLRAPDGSAVHGMARRDGVVVQFSPAGPSEAKRGVGVTLYVQVGDDDIDAYYSLVKRNGATIIDEIKDQFWGDRSFIVADSDGYALMFAKQVKDMSMEALQQAIPAAN